MDIHSPYFQDLVAAHQFANKLAGTKLGLKFAADVRKDGVHSEVMKAMEANHELGFEIFENAEKVPLLQ